MSYYIYDVNGYVGDLASNRGMEDLRSALANNAVLKPLFTEGHIHVTDDVTKAIASIPADAKTEDFVALTKKCEDVIIITDGVFDASEKAVRRDYAEALRQKLEGALKADMKGALKKALALLEERIRAEAKAESQGKSTGLKQVMGVPDDEELWTEIRAEIRGALTPHIRKVSQAAAEYKRNLGLAVDMEKVDEHLLEFTRSYSNEWWARLEPVTRKGLRDALLTWQETGLGQRGLDDLVDTLASTLFSPERAERIAVTEVTRIFDEANRAAELTAGIENQVWLTARDEIVCDVCLPLDGEEFPISSGPFPVTDTHINCRCLRTGVTSSGEVLRD